MLELKQITKDFGRLQVLKGIDMHIEPGQTVSITGSSGAGKSTLIGIAAGIDRPTSGQVLFNQTDIHKLKSSKLAQFRNSTIGFVFQFHHLLPEFTALENVMLPALFAGKSRSEAKRQATDLLDFVGLGQRTDHKPNELSGGEQQRAAVARALINNPKLVFADEPTGNLDATNADLIHQIFFAAQKERNTSFLLVTHNLTLASQTNRHIVLHQGSILNNTNP